MLLIIDVPEPYYLGTINESYFEMYMQALTSIKHYNTIGMSVHWSRQHTNYIYFIQTKTTLDD